MITSYAIQFSDGTYESLGLDTSAESSDHAFRWPTWTEAFYQQQYYTDADPNCRIVELEHEYVNCGMVDVDGWQSTTHPLSPLGRKMYI
jgi:hypothetical protein